jgi:asparagine N-glycosylation enzyme membrane subunit Stt3
LRGKVRGFENRWPRRVLALWACFSALPTAALFVMGHFWYDAPWGFVSLAATSSVAFIALVVYRRHRTDLFLLSVATLTLSILLAALVWRLLGLEFSLFSQSPQSLRQAAMGLFFVIEAALALGWLRRQARLARTEGATL